MEGAFGWLGSLMEWFGAFFPRLDIIKKTHGGVAFVRGKNVKEVKPGLVLWWPLWTELMTYPVVRQSLNLPSQTLTTKDGKSVTVGAVVVYTVEDIITALTKQWDLAETVQDLSMAAVCDFITSSDFAWINQNRAVVKQQLTEQVVGELGEYGIAVRGAWLTDFAQAKVISIAGGSTYVPVEEEEEE